MTRKFFDYRPDELDFVPFDIETTGFKASEGDFVTNVVLHNDEQYHIWLNTDGNTDVDCNSIHADIVEGSGLDNIVLYVCESEKLLLENLSDYLNAHTSDSTVLTAFNGETYRGNTDFDLPFLRTRFFRNGVEWAFRGYWYTDSYEVLSQKNRFDTTVKAEPRLESMKLADVKQFVDDMGFDIHYGKMKKAEVVRAVEQNSAVTEDMLSAWVEENNVADVNPENPGSFNKPELEQFIDDKSLGIPYDKLSKNELVREIRERDYNESMLIEWHEQTGRSIGTMEASTLDDIHKYVIEDKLHDESWRQSLPFELEVFEPFDPYDDSGEAVTGFMDEDYSGVILHCFADVARTVNLTRMMAYYVPQQDYQPKIL